MMYISPINYQTHVKTNNPIKFKSKPTFTKPAKTGKRTFAMFAASVLAYFGFTKKSTNDIQTQEVNNTSATETNNDTPSQESNNIFATQTKEVNQTF